MLFKDKDKDYIVFVLLSIMTRMKKSSTFNSIGFVISFATLTRFLMKLEMSPVLMF